ncbi:WD40 repeat domain-containing protein [Shinella sp. S4-D37]|uniref:WD40 repeat domain-containing protein n=1 Tax=Shinella sp. S4-D37 TaxID=3161999 RepID=UPI003464FB7A
MMAAKKNLRSVLRSSRLMAVFLLVFCSTCISVQARAETWPRQTIMLSEVWAQRSKALLDQGQRYEAIEAALKGIPEAADDEDISVSFAKAHLALYFAYRSFDTHLPTELFEGDSELGYYVAPDRTRALTTSYENDGVLRLDLWDLTQSNKMPIRLDYPVLNIHRAHVFIVISNDSKWAAVSVPDGTVRVYDLRDGQLAATLAVTRQPPDGEPLMPFQLGFSPDSKLLTATATVAPLQSALVTRMWAVGDFTEVLSDKVAGPGPNKPGSVQFIDDTTICRRHPDDAYGTRTLRFETLSVDGRKQVIDLTGVIGVWDSLFSHACSPDLKWFALSGYDGRHRYVLINAETREVVHEFSRGGWSVDAFNVDSSQLAVHGEQGRWTFQFFDLATLEWLPDHPHAPQSFSMTLPYAYSERTTRQPTGDFHLYSAYGGHLLWESIPTGTALAQAALETLPSDTRNVVDAERLR